MGYEIADTETLTFDDRPGLEVVVRRATTFESFEKIQHIAGEGTGAEQDKALQDFASEFIESWNVSVKGEPLPISEFSRVPIEMKYAILAKWMDLIRRPDAPLGQESSNGPDSPAPSTNEQASE